MWVLPIGLIAFFAGCFVGVWLRGAVSRNARREARRIAENISAAIEADIDAMYAHNFL